ncbi:hypothetical protein ZWY2020_057667 [Hordeum vulgare]|nr:hypothetical protein ZWY2020_057667 [Hordeum vulgare]
MAKASYAVGFWIRETGRALDRLGCRLQGNYFFPSPGSFCFVLYPPQAARAACERRIAQGRERIAAAASAFCGDILSSRSLASGSVAHRGIRSLSERSARRRRSRFGPPACTRPSPPASP